MAAQRPPTIAPALRASAADLPLRDNSVDAAMAVLTIHHWDDELERGIQEMRRVARDTVVILTYDPLVSGEMWLIADYLPEVAELDRASSRRLGCSSVGWAAGRASRQCRFPRDTPDWMLGSFWAHPERVLDERARNATSGFARSGCLGGSTRRPRCAPRSRKWCVGRTARPPPEARCLRRGASAHRQRNSLSASRSGHRQRYRLPTSERRWPHRYSASVSPEPPSSAGKSLSLGRPSFIGRTVDS